MVKAKRSGPITAGKRKKQKINFLTIQFPWQRGRVDFYKYLVLFELTAVLIMLGYLIFLYQGFSILPEYVSRAPEQTCPGPTTDTLDDSAGAEPSQATMDLKFEFIIARGAVERYFAKHKTYPRSLDGLVSEFMGADELSREFEYYVNQAGDEYELNVDLGVSAGQIMANDGGNDTGLYELGTDLKLK
ncbi:hypothetical protein KJ969_02615 [Patescibacteria group bacterium]|nr:hypothetical protein [Patescibacteria group bacterium]MBU1922370.1 hypothetical protein [Patescibacteria group bacterium]